MLGEGWGVIQEERNMDQLAEQRQPASCNHSLNTAKYGAIDDGASFDVIKGCWG